jgi:C-terminal processing protease CtpA/Prc
MTLFFMDPMSAYTSSEQTKSGQRSIKCDVESIGYTVGMNFFLRLAQQTISLYPEHKLGAKEASINIARNLLNLNIPIEEIIKATGLTKEEIESIL